VNKYRQHATPRLEFHKPPHQAPLLGISQRNKILDDFYLSGSAVVFFRVEVREEVGISNL
jgi:hypothetical protein